MKSTAVVAKLSRANGSLELWVELDADFFYRKLFLLYNAWLGVGFTAKLGDVSLWIEDDTKFYRL